MNTETTLYRAHITLGNLVVPPYPGGELFAIDELPGYYPANQAAEVIKAKVILKLDIHHTDAASVRVAKLLTHAQLHERGVSPIAAHRLLESEGWLGFPRYIAPELTYYAFDNPRSVQMFGQMHAGVMQGQVDGRVPFRAVVDQLEDGGDVRRWMVPVGTHLTNLLTPHWDCDGVAEGLPSILARHWELDADCIEVVEVALLDECRLTTRLPGAPLAYLWEYSDGTFGPHLWPEAMTCYDLVPDDLRGYLQLVRESLGEGVVR
ncbi:hypothetical protein VITFI_CDS0621 [Vitreoscilla filiformis]|jgi:hypothetical protein|uniref:Uncharacterized protein n=1 Tax=Vitreoscilla filiformis TaxID=63 RepID=A0A221KC31_VITFI|nr:hypothetical protein [Vitreoscilla filiformis]ASM76400.1 hypothetical protein VITFI_CDS0621 [Vitreoscilla filiformis]